MFHLRTSLVYTSREFRSWKMRAGHKRKFLLVTLGSIAAIFWFGYYIRVVYSESEQLVEVSTERRNSDSLIFFWDTSGRNTLNFRQSCCVESAARRNPHSLVKLYMSTTAVNESSASILLFQELPNVEITPINLEIYFTNTPLAKWYTDGIWKTSPYSVTHMSDYLRVLSAYKHGGLYLDTDFIILRSLKDLHNFVAYESGAALNGAAFHFDQGHPVIYNIVNYLAANYKPESWAANGPDVFTKFVKDSNCGNKTTTDSSFEAKCGSGVNVLGADSFYPFHYSRWRVMFQNNTSDQLPRELDQAYGVHLWNKLSVNEPVFVGSLQFYSLLAAKNCPLSYAAAVRKF